MSFIINAPIDPDTGKPTGKPWQAGFKTNQKQESKVMQQTVQPLSVPGVNLRKLNTNFAHGEVQPLSALGYSTNEIGHVALWNRLQAVLDKGGDHDFPMLQEVFDDHLIYEIDNKLYKRGFSLDANDQPTLHDDVSEVIEQIEYQEPLTTHEGVEPMSALGFGR